MIKNVNLNEELNFIIEIWTVSVKEVILRKIECSMEIF